MNHSLFRTGLLIVAVSALAMLAYGQTRKPQPKVGPQSTTANAADVTALLLKEVKALKAQTAELKTKLGAAEARLASVEAKNAAQDGTIANKQDKMPIGPNYAGGGWCTKQVFLTAMDPNKTMIHYIAVK